MKQYYKYTKLGESMGNAEVEEGICDFKIKDVEKHF